ncbi:recombinase RmuC [Thioclava sp. SK-1]|uniref:DNA recombination protein RmuC n=1 Tax=Thioclava sp. SK-1 TaxID=1889770 RepID=UPI00082659E9|nr:DNA recombination protein RmuC [Thioclava sp. SK-1]OCX65798.1 recombinase RmuC [Thioclava sp. SK-1]
MIQIGTFVLDLKDPLAQAVIALLLLAVFLLILWQSTRRRLSQARQDLAQAAPYRAEATALREALLMEEVQAQRVPDLERDLATTREQLKGEFQHRVQVEQALHSLRREHEARLEELRGMKQEITDKFSSVATGILTQNSEAFLNLVSERFKTHEQVARDDLDRRRIAIETLVKPLNERLGQFGQQISDIEKSRGEAYGAIHQQVQILAQGQAHLGQETRKLVQALRAPKTRGRWGEMQLRQVFEMAGMSENVDFHLEHHIATETGALRPDAVVHIPGGRSIVVDAKTPLEAYLDALEAETPDQQSAAIARHAGHVRAHVKALSSKSYQANIDGTPDFVVMFIPGETFVAAAAEADPGLIEYAFQNKVLIASPTTLMALIKAIAYGWQQDKMAKNAQEVQKTAKDLYDRLKLFGSHVDGIGRALQQSVERYNRAVGSLETRVLPAARKFEAMGVVGEDQVFEAPNSVDISPRALSSPLLTGQE